MLFVPHKKPLLPIPLPSDDPGREDIQRTLWRHQVSKPTAPLAADTTEVDDTDSAIGDTDTESTMTLPSHVLNYQHENGRTYHAYRQGTYMLVKCHTITVEYGSRHLFKGGRGKLFLAPIQKPQKVLDIGTGTAIEFANKFGAASVIGTDLSPIQPTWVPQNVEFIVDDAEADWAFKPDFDFIHVRTLGTGIRDMERLLEQCYKHLKPGGWVELQDGEARPSTDDGSLTSDHALWKWVDHLEKASIQAGRKISIAPVQKCLITGAGFNNIKEEVYKTPIGTWPKRVDLKEIGKYTKAVLLEGLDSYSLALFARVLEWELARVHLLLAEVRNDLKDPKIHAYYRLHFTYGQKPLVTSTET
ncbi:MAG: hypothetical protein M1840_003100 [Geoglossum simile]|nr:MAG: hypothetical protein M1840_003100 [Geoglossum simile]